MKNLNTDYMGILIKLDHIVLNPYHRGHILYRHCIAEEEKQPAQRVLPCPCQQAAQIPRWCMIVVSPVTVGGQYVNLNKPGFVQSTPMHFKFWNGPHPHLIVYDIKDYIPPCYSHNCPRISFWARNEQYSSISNPYLFFILILSCSKNLYILMKTFWNKYKYKKNKFLYYNILLNNKDFFL